MPPFPLSVRITQEYLSSDVKVSGADLISSLNVSHKISNLNIKCWMFYSSLSISCSRDINEKGKQKIFESRELGIASMIREI